MSELDIIRAWKDKTYRNSLSIDELAQLPENPAGTIELTNDELAGVDGAATPSILTAASLVSVIVTSLATLIGYTGYRLGTNGSAASCCPCQPTPPSGQ